MNINTANLVQHQMTIFGYFQNKEFEEINMTEAEITNVSETMEMQTDADDSYVPDTGSDSTVIADDELRKLMEEYEVLKDKMDSMQAERNVLREQISGHLQDHSIEYTEVPVPSGRAYKVSLSTRIIETVTREGKSFIKVHATPELLESLVKSVERETLAIREMTGVPRQSLFNRLNEQE